MSMASMWEPSEEMKQENPQRRELLVVDREWRLPLEKLWRYHCLRFLKAMLRQASESNWLNLNCSKGSLLRHTCWSDHCRCQKLHDWMRDLLCAYHLLPSDCQALISNFLMLDEDESIDNVILYRWSVIINPSFHSSLFSIQSQEWLDPQWTRRDCSYRWRVVISCLWLSPFPPSSPSTSPIPGDYFKNQQHSQYGPFENHREATGCSSTKATLKWCTPARRTSETKWNGHRSNYSWWRNPWPSKLWGPRANSFFSDTSSPFLLCRQLSPQVPLSWSKLSKISKIIDNWLSIFRTKEWMWGSWKNLKVSSGVLLNPPRTETRDPLSQREICLPSLALLRYLRWESNFPKEIFKRDAVGWIVGFELCVRSTPNFRQNLRWG